MSFSRASLVTAVAAAGLLTAPGHAAKYVEIFSEATAGNGEPGTDFIDSVATNGLRDAYAVMRGFVGDSGVVTKVVDGTFVEVVMSEAQWAAAGTGSDLGGSFGTGLVGSDTLGIINFFDSTYYKIDLATGTPVPFVTAAQFGLAAGGSVNITSANEVLPDGSAYAYDGNSDQILYVDAAGNVTVEVTAADLASLTGSATLSTPGFAVVGNDLYFGSNVGDSLYKWDTVNDLGSVVLDTNQLEALSDDIDGSAGVDDIFYAPDGLVYFYEDDADYLYSFDPLNPVGSLAVVLTEAELNAGPGSDSVGELQWYRNRISWTDQSDGFYSLIPSPAAAGSGLVLLGALAARRRRG